LLAFYLFFIPLFFISNAVKDIYLLNKTKIMNDTVYVMYVREKERAIDFIDGFTVTHRASSFMV